MSAALDVTELSRTRTDPVARARAIAPVIEAASQRIEQSKALTPEVLDALHGAALFRTLLPRAYNGEQVTPATFFRMQEVIAAADGSTGWCLCQASGCSFAAAYMAPEAAWDIWGDPRAVVAWGFGQGVAKVVPGGYRVSGTWRFASGNRHATWVGGHCRIEEPDGSIRLDKDGAVFERTMMVRRDVPHWHDEWNVVGLCGTNSDTYTITDVFVPEAYSVTRDVDEERRVQAPLYQFTTTNLYASGFAGVSLGIARGMLDAFVAMARGKTAAAMTKPMRESEVIQNGIAQCEAKLRSAGAWLVEVLDEAHEVATARGHITMHERAMIRLATTSAIHRAKEVAEWAYHEAGATAIFDNSPFERRMRDIHASAQQVQGRTAHLEMCGQHFLGMNPAGRFF
ncbi:acyl-CoA dehydrogenase [Siccirubricoccus deserti]|uniref:Acyl-CoA dehydrogenase n=1 Tax=Siccirubricoccus deserti TaxID=2013562 RepID=A0A9X0QZX1_9PROT|nr:acyl-CoA dehydrogenase family protein [Siccirubricoccus deserti]MBC4016268.1 acyl-CoA dehydrogenase [Siccirubricoccus deserti]GGC48501.1 acyl-CoA dehydrogenase [Siccirubricoccus deserti]